MKFEITTMVENTVQLSRGLVGEHGQSFLVECDGACVLFDTGQGGALPGNAARLGKNLGGVKTLVLSHGHYDHSGGIAELIKANSSFELLAHPDAFSQKIANMPGMGTIPIGMDMDEKGIESAGVRVRLERGSVEVAPGIYTSGEVPMRNDFEVIEPVLMRRTRDGDGPDPLADDLSLVLRTDKGLVILLGCAHRGVVNIVDHVLETFGGDSVHAVIGGFHLERASDSQLQKTVEALEKRKVEKIVTSHCTGMWATIAMLQKFKGRVSQNFVGAKFVF